MKAPMSIKLLLLNIFIIACSSYLYAGDAVQNDITLSNSATDSCLYARDLDSVANFISTFQHAIKKMDMETVNQSILFPIYVNDGYSINAYSQDDWNKVTSIQVLPKLENKLSIQIAPIKGDFGYEKAKGVGYSFVWEGFFDITGSTQYDEHDDCSVIIAYTRGKKNNDVYSFCIIRVGSNLKICGFKRIIVG